MTTALRDSIQKLEARFQSRVHEWLVACLGIETAKDERERSRRFLEEALELVQSVGLTREDCQRLIDFVYGRPAGDPWQEAGGTLMALAALCTATGISLDEAGELELRRRWDKIEAIRAKDATKKWR